MTPQDLMDLENLIHRLDEEYWNGSDSTKTDALNDLADRAEEIRTAWMNDKARS